MHGQFYQLKREKFILNLDLNFQSINWPLRYNFPKQKQLEVGKHILNRYCCGGGSKLKNRRMQWKWWGRKCLLNVCFLIDTELKKSVKQRFKNKIQITINAKVKVKMNMLMKERVRNKMKIEICKGKDKY